MDALEELRGFIDNEQFVSFRWFANCLDIQIEKTKIIFDEFKKSNKDVFATYCISGKLKNNEHSMYIIAENLLDKYKELFIDINCIHIYSLQKIKFQDNNSISNQLNSADTQQANEMIAQRPQCASFLLNNYGGIKMDDIKIKPIGKKSVLLLSRIYTILSSVYYYDKLYFTNACIN